MITINFGKAQGITKDRLRAERAPLLLAQDIAYQRAVEQDLPVAPVFAEKQRLRDITDTVMAATTLDALKGLSAAV